jgi:hypothetical protein
MESVQQAKELYGLIHSRFLTTGKGLSLIREKYLNGIYGHCPRILCDKQVLIPVGLSEDMKYSRVKVKNYRLIFRYFAPNVKKFTSLDKNVLRLMVHFLELLSLKFFFWYFNINYSLFF